MRGLVGIWIEWCSRTSRSPYYCTRWWSNVVGIASGDGRRAGASRPILWASVKSPPGRLIEVERRWNPTIHLQKNGDTLDLDYYVLSYNAEKAKNHFQRFRVKNSTGRFFADLEKKNLSPTPTTLELFIR